MTIRTNYFHKTLCFNGFFESSFENSKNGTSQETISPGEYADPDANFDVAQILTPEQKHTLQTNSLDSLSLAQGKMPIIIFSHGMGGAPDDYCILLEEIASHGYVVLNLHHYSSSGSVPSGEKSIRDKDS